MKSIIIDDDAVVRELLAQYIEESPELKLEGSLLNMLSIEE